MHDAGQTLELLINCFAAHRTLEGKAAKRRYAYPLIGFAIACALVVLLTAGLYGSQAALSEIV